MTPLWTKAYLKRLVKLSVVNIVGAYHLEQINQKSLNYEAFLCQLADPI